MSASQGQGDQRYDRDEADLLLRCAREKDLTPWNRWRRDHPQKEIWLEGAILADAFLQGADLHEAHLGHANLEGSELQGAQLWGAHLDGAIFWHAQLDDGDLQGASLRGAHLEHTSLRGANLLRSKLIGASLQNAHLERADLSHADLSRADLKDAHLNEAALEEARLDGTNLTGTHLEGASFARGIVDGATLLWACAFDKRTDFSGVGLTSARIQPGTRSRLEGNIRRRMWQSWYREHPLAGLPVRLFWGLSDYGQSTLRVLLSACIFAVLFAAAYYLDPGLVSNLHGQSGSPILEALRALYFSVVTMTTLGFGDIYANPTSWLGHILLMIQVILGYVLLGALVTRLSILFQST